MWMQADEAVINSAVPRDVVAAFTAATLVGAAEEPGRAVWSDAQRTGSAAVDGAAVPTTTKRWRGVHVAEGVR